MVSRPELEFEKHMLEVKKKRFENVVLRASTTLGLLKPPKVKFWEGYCPHGAGNDEWAHIHWDKGIICVSESMLKQMSHEKIEETATHEVTHMIEHAHDIGFYTKMGKTMQADWEPKGVIVENGSEKTVKNTKNIGKDETRCNYHACRKEAKLKKCPLCDGYFCKDHFSPKMALMLQVVFEEKDRELKYMLEKEYRREDAHPCWPYNEVKLEEFKDKRREYYEKLKNVLEKNRKLEGIIPAIETIHNIEHSLIERPIITKHLDGIDFYGYECEFQTKKAAKKAYEFFLNKRNELLSGGFRPKITLNGKFVTLKYKRILTPEENPTQPKNNKFSIQTKAVVVIILLIVAGYFIFTYNKEIMKFLPMHQNTPIECIANYTKAYESTASFGRDPSAYCKKTCNESYNSTIYRVIEPNQTSKLTVCWCDVNNCNT